MRRNATSALAPKSHARVRSQRQTPPERVREASNGIPLGRSPVRSSRTASRSEESSRRGGTPGGRSVPRGRKTFVEEEVGHDDGDDRPTPRYSSSASHPVGPLSRKPIVEARGIPTNPPKKKPFRAPTGGPNTRRAKGARPGVRVERTAHLGPGHERAAKMPTPSARKRENGQPDADGG